MITISKSLTHAQYFTDESLWLYLLFIGISQLLL
jgi:hypothetical protein